MTGLVGKTLKVVVVRVTYLRDTSCTSIFNFAKEGSSETLKTFGGE